MLKLFRKIRQQLIEKGNLKSYLFYALGEILLVMIGILLALQVNNWNQDRIENKKELKALRDLNKEFNLNKDRIKQKQELRIAIVAPLKTYIQSLANEEADYNAFKEFHAEPFLFGMTNPSNGVIDALISSGEIALISNDSLKYYLADWENQLENLYENEQILWNSGLAYIGSYARQIPDGRYQWKDWERKKLSEAYKALISKVEYRNNLVGFEGVNIIVIEECDEILKQLEQMISFLEEEIETH